MASSRRSSLLAQSTKNVRNLSFSEMLSVQGQKMIVDIDQELMLTPNPINAFQASFVMHWVGLLSTPAFELSSIEDLL